MERFAMNMQSIGEFKESLTNLKPPADFSIFGQALWWAGKGNWAKSHALVQGLTDQAGSLIHAYLHRREGDLSNAQYWYSKANTKMPTNELNKEWEDLVVKFFKLIPK